MPEESGTLASVRFGRFDFSAETGELRKDGQRLKLSGQAIQVLAMLVANPGKLVTREELQQKLWPGASFGDPEHGLNAAVNKLREALGDSAAEPKYIETVPGRGYRFIGVIESENPQRSQNELEPPKPPWKLKAAIALFVCGAVALLFVAARMKRISPEVAGRTKPSSPEIIPVVTLPGQKFTPSISPDGNEIAFAYQREEGSNLTDIYIKGVDDDRVTRLTFPPGDSYSPSWSPDGQQIVYVRLVEISPNNWHRNIMLMTRLGGNQHLLRSAATGVGDRVSWTPDGKTLLYVDKPDDEQAGIFAMSLDGSGARRITTTSDLDEDPVVSPDGKTVAFVRSVSLGLWDLYTVPISGGEPRRVTTIQGGVESPVWTPDGRSIIFAADLKSGGSPNLYSVPATGGVPEPLPFVGFEASHPSISGNGDRLVLLKTLPGNVTIWRMGLNPVSEPALLSSPPATAPRPSGKAKSTAAIQFG